MKTLSEIQRGLRNKFLASRNLCRLVESEDFKEAFLKAPESERVKAQNFIDKLDRESLARWVKLQLIDVDQERTVKQLRERASELGIAYYNLLSKTELMAAIEQRESA